MRVLVVDQHPVPLSAIVAVVKDALPEARVEVFENVREAVDAIGAGVELFLCGRSTGAALGPEWIQELVRLSRPGKLVVLGHQDRASCAQAHAGGAWAHIPLTVSAEVMAAAVRLIVAGGHYFPSLHPMVMTEDGLVEPERSRALLSRRQREVLSLLEQGLPNRDIAAQLGISLPTVKLHVQAILKALGAKNRTEAARLARQVDLG